MQGLDALTTEDVQMVRAVEVLDSLGVLLAELFLQAVFVFVLEVKARARQDGVFFDDLVQDVDVEGQALSTFELLDELATDGAADSVLVVQLLNAVRAQSMPAVDQDAGNPFAHVVLQAAELADVQAARLIVKIHQVDGHFASLLAVTEE